MTNLVTWDVDQNSLVGTIPSAMSKMSKLKTVILSSNSLTGTVPSALSQLVKLTSINVQDNLLTNGFPAELTARSPTITLSYDFQRTYFPTGVPSQQTAQF